MVLIKKFPLTFGFTFFSLLIFAYVNHFGKLPDEVLGEFGFSASAPTWEWGYRTFTSDWLYLNSTHFLACVIPMIFVLIWAERTHTRKFLLITLGLVSFFDDYVNFFMIAKPFHFIRPALFHLMSSEKDVGSSLILSALLGLQLCQIKKNRELYFVGIAMISIFGTVFSTSQYTSLILNLNHFVFLSFGYVFGKLRYEYLDRERVRRWSE